LYEEEILDNICEWSCGSEAALRCYSTGLLSIGLRDRSIADIAVNKDTPITFLKRARLYASKLEKERQLAVKYMQDRARNSTSKQKKVSVSADATGKSTFRTNTSVVIGLKRKVSGGTEKFSVEADVSSMEETFVNTGESINSQILRQEDGQFSDVPEDISTLPDPYCHEEDLKKLVMLELLYTLDCIGSLGEYLELFAPALKEDIVGTIITFLHSKNPTVLAHSIKLTSHFLAHKKFALSMIDAGGVELILASYHLTSTVVGSQLHRSISMCLHGFASSSAVMEKILYLDGETLLSVAFGLLSSPNDRARQNAVVFLGLTIPFKVVMDYFEKQNGLYILLNIIRAGNNPRSSAQRQLSHDACLCLRQYLRVQVALVAHRLRRKLSQLHYHPFSSSTPLPAVPGGRKSCLSARVPKLSALKPVDIDDKAHEQNLIFFEKYRFSAGSFCTGHEIWSPAVRLSHLRGILIMLEVVAMGCTVVHEGNPEDASSTIRLWLVERAHFCLESLRMLTLVATSLAPEVCATEVSYSFRENDDEAEEVDHVSPGKKKVGVSLLLEIATSSNAKDADLIREALHVLCNCVSPPHGEECWQHPYKDLRQFTLTARSQRRYTPSVENLSDHVLPQSQQGNGNMSGEKFASVVSAGNFVCCAKAKDDKALRPLRKLAREKNAIKVCVQLLRYKRSVQNADAIRLLATRVLLGLSRDRQIAQILEKMQIGQLLSDLIRQEPVLEENADLHVRFRECAMDLISLVTHRAPSAVINEAADPTVRKIEKASIVAQTKINYDSQELLRIIHEHLLSRGLDKAADVLAKEADLVDHNPKTQFSSSVEYIHSPSAAKVTRILLPSSDISSVMHPEGEPRAPKIRRLHLSADSETKSPRGPSPQTLTPSSQLEITVPLAYSLRKKQIKKAMMSPHLFQRNDIQQAETMVQRQLARSKSICSSAQLSKLDEIICHYLREQHRHCVNPVTTVPPFKLSSAASFHRCPDPPSTSSLNVNIFKRLATRSVIRNAAHWSFSAVSSDIINRYVFSRYRPFRVVGSHGASYWGGMCSSEFLGVNQLLTGNYNGEIRLWNLDSDSVVEEWSCHEGSLPIVDLQANVHTRLGTQSSLFISGTAGYMPYEHSEIALWDLKNMSSSRWRFDGRSARFNTYGDRVVALDIRMHVNEDWEDRSDSVRSNVNGAVLLDVATGEVLAELKDNTFTNGYGAETNCIFAHCDTIVLSDGVLWDVRMSSIRAIHKFDKLSNSGFGHFHPNGNEVLVNSAVWDLRTYRLLRMVPSLDKCNLMFNTTGNAIYAYHAYGAGVRPKCIH
jgi:hypothetical protein